MNDFYLKLKNYMMNKHLSIEEFLMEICRQEYKYNIEVLRFEN